MKNEKNTAVADGIKSSVQPNTLTDPQALTSSSKFDSLADSALPNPSAKYTNDSDAESLDMVRKILLGDQMRKAEKQQASLERQIRDSVEGINKEMQQQVNGLRKALQALEQKTSDWRHDMLTHIEQADRKVQKQEMNRQEMADLLRSMARQLTEQDVKPAYDVSTSKQ